MGQKLESRAGGRLNSSNFIRTPFSKAVVSVDYAAELKILEVEFGENQKIYHYQNVEKHFYEEILNFKQIRDSQPELPEKELEEKYSIGKFVNQQIKPPHDYYELQLLHETP